MTFAKRSLVEVATALRTGELALPAYLEALAHHFEEQEPQVQAFVPQEGRFERLQQEAETLLARYPQPEERPSLFGVPVGVKDIFHVDGFVTRAGSKLPPQLWQGAEAPSVTALRRAGALIVGKTVTTEFAYFAPGPTRNPHNPAHTPGGSSSGSAAGVGAGLCLLALGSQTIGSVNRPAAFCGVVGYKPSFDRISKEGVLPLSPSLDHVGFFTPGVAGVAAVAPLLCRQWQPTTAAEKPVLGIPEGPYLEHASEEGLAYFRATGTRLTAAGFTVKPVPALADFEQIYERHYQIVNGELAQVHAQWYAQYADLYHAKTAEYIQRGQQIDSHTLAQALAGRQKLRRELVDLMDSHGLDLWLSPAAPGPAPKGLESTGNPAMNLPWTHAGLPTLSLPAGFNDAGLPLGLQVAGRWYKDEAMVAWAAMIEAALE